jgi:hypothetical protein
MVYFQREPDSLETFINHYNRPISPWARQIFKKAMLNSHLSRDFGYG